ncbi:scaffold prohead core protein [Synechococcus phage ACG-2014b]|uniref:Scaffold prohead core protein n=2 Tax=Synechococcus phage ACG-2014b TaxID=1493508 RepID=A0A0E3F7E3_9CAUD|nr:head scaffolding protein [Synechococcus phage ACG-2014b]YP_009779740.1 head scaffolding protein [Synechococcus phage ACG-2014b]AIX17334.1 scaffold prohead core protein [Synechococcus phage ACG-2014b]AIX17765.1 scaffold prohead core protein [Synechococcus phage ACG-2014b]AIX17982.1 scaffold prohead core protein [Synechococcus phage ACG-2014b]AIX18197.1 scaffold prohead core protein [Synechococcus phage ACG-2014b]AIX19355.1 scaffold prohead core protein [Synechococcus phage ACG-2014b]
MAETSLDKELDNMEEVTEGSNAVTKDAKPGEKINTSGGGAAKVVDVTSDSMEGAKGTKNAGASAAKAVGKAPVPGTKPSDASAKMEDVEEDGEETIAETEYDFTEDVDALVAGEELSEEFRLKAATIFEAAVTSKVNAEVAALQEAFESTLTEEVEKIQTELAEKVDDYLTYAAESWMKENSLQIEHGIKTEMAESFFNGLKGLFLEHNFTVPEEKFNLLDGMVEEIDDMEAKLNEQIDANVSLNKRIGEFVKMEIVNECATGLAETQKERLHQLAEGVEFETEEDFQKKVETIKESYFTRKAELAESVSDPSVEAAEPLVEETTSGSMSKYVDAIARWSK